MKDQKFERENKKIILGMVIGTVVSVALFLRKVKHNKKFGFIFCLNFNLNIF